MIALRQNEPVLLAGRFEPQRSQGNALLFERRLDDRSLLIALNIGNQEQIVQIHDRAIHASRSVQGSGRSDIIATERGRELFSN